MSARAAGASSDMGSEHYCLRWNNHQSNLLGVFSQLLHDESLVDVTLACSEGASIRAHKVVLSACSSYFQSLFVDHPSRHPIVILKDVRFTELRTLVEFMYKGEVNVEYCQLSALLKTAESLKVKGLAEMTELRATSGELATSLGATVERMDESVPQDLRAPELPSAPEPSLERTPLTPDHTIQSINCGQNDNMGINMSISSNKNGSSRGALCSPSSELRLAALSSLAAPPPARHSSPPVPLSVPARHEPIAGPSGMPPVQQVPLSLKKEVEWDRMPDDKNVGESSTDYRIPHETICTDTACTSGISGGISARDSAPLAIWSPLLAFHACRLRRYLSDDCLGYEASHVGTERRRCAVCFAAFPSAWLLERHAALQHASQTSCEDKPFVCEQCGQSYRYRSAYVKHREQNHRARLPADKLFTCDVCGMQFRYLKSFKKHRLNHALERLHTKSAEIRPEGIDQVSSTNESIVGQCGEMDLSIRKFKSRPDEVDSDANNIKRETVDQAADSEQDNTVDSNDLIRGEAISKNISYNIDCITPDIKLRDTENDSISTDEGRRRVPVSFASVSSIADSSENESSRVESSGPITDTASSSRLGLLGFLQSSDVDRQRERERRFACPFCGKCVRSKENLKLHVRKHTGERPFVCLFCGRAFGGKSDLTRHLRIHTGERPYHCEACGKCFARADYLSKHLTTHVHNAR